MKITITYEKLIELVGKEQADKILNYYLSTKRPRGRPKKNIPRERILNLLIRFNNNKSAVSRLLGISRATLYKILNDH